MSRAFRCARLTMLAGTLLCVSALAQSDPQSDPQNDPQSDQQDDPPGEMPPEIVVTAQKIEQSLEEVPASVSSLDSSFLRDVGATGFAELQDYTANVDISLSPSAGTFGVRGLTTPDTNTAFDPSVGSVIDGVSYGRSNFLGAFFHDLDRVEVLRGPQGTLFGKNATAGLFNVVTRAPKPDFSATAELLAQDYGNVSLRPAVTVPIGERLSARLSGNYEHGNDGILKNTFLDRPESNPVQDTTRLRLRWEPSSDWRFDLGLLHSRQAQNFNIFQLTRASDDMLALARQYDPQTEANIDGKTSENFPSREDVRFRAANISADYRPGPFLQLEKPVVTSITAWADSTTFRRDIDADFTAVPFIHDELLKPARFRQLSQELRIAARTPDLFGWGHGVLFVTGIYVYDARFTTSDLFAVEDLGAAFSYLVAAQSGQQDAPFPPGSGGTVGGALGGPLGAAITLLNPAFGPVIGSQQSARVTLDQDTRAYAYFGQFEHFVLEDWAIIGGLRFSFEEKTGRATSLAQGELVPLIADQDDHDTSIKREEFDLSPKAGLKWQPNEFFSAYFTWAQGYKSGGFNALPLTPRNLEYDPELATSYEVGFKGRGLLFGGPVRGSVAVFHTVFEDLQVSTFRDGAFIILNAAEARTQGFEAEMQWLPPLRGAALYTSLGYADASYTRYRDAPGISDSGTATQDLSGEPLAFAPKFSAALVPAYRIALAESVGATLAVDLGYRGARFLDVDNDARKRQPATVLTNLRVVFSDEADRWAVTMALRNLENKKVLDQAISQPLAPGNFVAVRTDYGRHLAMSLAYTFP